MFAPSDLLLLD